jgi:hypothetical protein
MKKISHTMFKQIKYYVIRRGHKNSTMKVGRSTLFTLVSLPLLLYCSPAKAIPSSTPPPACLNSPTYRYDHDDQGHGCQWIRNKEDRRISLCQESEVREECPQTCGICCENNPDYKFQNKLGEMKSCKWLGKNEVRQDKYCDTYNNKNMVKDMCPLACDFCQSEVKVSKAPSPSPTPLPTPSGCLNNPTYFYNDEKEHGCQWIRKEESRRTSLCLESDVRIQCPQACGICCEDNSEYELINNLGKAKGCNWLGTKIRRQLKYCDTYNNKEMVRNMCPLSCDFCQEVVPVTTVVKSVMTFDLCGICSKEVGLINTDAIASVFKQNIIERGADPDTVEVIATIDGCSESCDAALSSTNRPFSFFNSFFQPFASNQNESTKQEMVIGATITSSDDASVDTEELLRPIKESIEDPEDLEKMRKTSDDEGLGVPDVLKKPEVDIKIIVNSPNPTQSPTVRTPNPTQKPTNPPPRPKPQPQPNPQPPPPPPTPSPTKTPSVVPSNAPSSTPSTAPSSEPSDMPSDMPSAVPSNAPSSTPNPL